nr:helicase and RNA-dependent RNA polymerase [Blunervirus sp.]
MSGYGYNLFTPITIDHDSFEAFVRSHNDYVAETLPVPNNSVSSAPKSLDDHRVSDEGFYQRGDTSSSLNADLEDVDAFLAYLDTIENKVLRFVDTPSSVVKKAPVKDSAKVVTFAEQPVAVSDQGFNAESQRGLFTLSSDSKILNDYVSYCRQIISIALTDALDSEPVEDIKELRNYRYCVINGDTFALVEKLQNLNAVTAHVSPHCAVLPELSYVSRSNDSRLASHKRAQYHLTLAGPGCGKSTALVKRVKKLPRDDVVVLTATKATCTELSAKLPGRRVYTCDSFVMHKSFVTAKIAVFDECFLMHPGKIAFCTGLLNAQKCYMYGDALQIPFIDRDNLLDHVPEVMDYFPVSEVLTKSYRCPSDVCAVLSEAYYDKLLEPYDISPGLYSENAVATASCTVDFISSVEDSKLRALRDFDMVLTFTQTEKFMVMKQCNVNVRTVHEFQGCEAEKVAVVRCYADAVPDHIYVSDEHCVVAISRHTKKLVYFTPTCEYDTLALLVRSCSSKVNLGGGITRLTRSNLHGLYRPPPRPVAAVPFNRQAFKFIDKSQAVYVCVGKVGGRDISMYGQKMLVNKNRRFTREVLENALLPFHDRLAGRMVTVKFSTFPHIDKNKVVKIFNRAGARYVDFSEASDFVGFNSHEAAMASALDFDAPLVEVRTSEVVMKEARHDYEVNYAGDPIADIQAMLNHFFRNSTFVDTSMDEYNFHMTDITFPIESIRLSCIRGLLESKRYDCMRPTISSPCPRPQSITARNAFHSIAKRNANVPCLTSVEDIPRQVGDMLVIFTTLCPNLRRDPICVSSEAIENWLSSQPMTVGSRIVPDRPIYDIPLNVYDFALKRSPKPDLSAECLDVYPAVQTILHQEKYVNAVFCPIWNEIRDRVVHALDPKFRFMTLCDDESFGEEISKILPPSKAKGLNVYEFDMSKYDKSQGALILEFECALMAYMGVPDVFINMWRAGHVLCTVRDHSCKISFRTIYQRKSGDASTYTGNTIALMIMLMDMMDPELVEMGLFSGDDSLIFSYEDSETINYSLSAYRYNLECKLFDFENHYFCSKFVLPFNDEWIIVPDPLKRAVKLGRFDLRNTEHVEEYRVSFVDNTRTYSMQPLHELISRALYERYSYFYYNCSNALSAMVCVARDKEAFQTLYYSLPSDNINHDVNLPTLEL